MAGGGWFEARRISCDKHLFLGASRTGHGAKYLILFVGNHTFNHVVVGSIPTPLTTAGHCFC